MDANGLRRANASGETPASTATADPQAASQVFRREGEYWTIEYAGTICLLRDGAGLCYLARLLGRPGERLPAFDLLACRASRRARTAATRSSDGERARVSVTRAIRAAILRCGAHNPALLEHLRATIRTGTTCSYTPDPRRTIEWQL